MPQIRIWLARKMGKNKIEWGSGVFFGQIFANCQEKKQEVVKGIKGSIWKKWAQLATL